MGNPPSLLYRLLSWFTGEPVVKGEPIVRRTNLQVLRIPADGSPPHLVQLNTIESDDRIDSNLRHVPDFRPYWGEGEGFLCRDIAEVEVRDQSPPVLNGLYFGWKSLALDLMPFSEYTGFCGDAFIAKTPIWERDENGAVYEDVPLAFLESRLLEVVLKRLHDV